MPGPTPRTGSRPSASSPRSRAFVRSGKEHDYELADPRHLPLCWRLYARRRHRQESQKLPGQVQCRPNRIGAERDQGAAVDRQPAEEQIAMLQWLLSFITAPVLNSIVDAYKARLAAANAQDKLAVDLAVKEIEAEIEARKSANAIIIAEQGRWWTSIIRPLAALPVVIFMWMVVV